MATQQVEERVGELLHPLIEEGGYELVDIQYKKEGGRWYLRLFVDHPLGMTLDRCEALSKEAEVILDAHDVIPHSYVFEVSSPGLERPLKKKADFVKFAGQTATIKTFAPVEGRRKFTGRIEGVTGEAVIITEGKDRWEIPLQHIASARLVFGG
ncbi:MAG: ribosome maturation factor RimP [Clostridia bacterium]|nr:ribosome maturation factor RimP [Clostridia bacterium]